jgi:DNA modification methylase
MIQPINDNPFAGQGLSVFDHNLELPRHRWYGFKEGFSENLICQAVDEVSSGISRKRPRLLDPFSGSGTSLVSSGRLGLNATGIEVNPFLAFTARAKCSIGRWNRVSFQNTLERVLLESKHESLSPLEGVSTFTEKNGLKKWLFNRSVLRGFTSLDIALKDTEKYQEPLRLALIASLMECCNATKDGKCLRYLKDWQSRGLNSNDLREVFRTKASTIIDDLVEHEFKGSGLKLLKGDSRTRLKRLKADSYDLIVTSPPYLNSFDYSDVYRPELFAGGFTNTNDELRRIRLQTLRSHIQVNWDPSSEISSSMLPPILSQLKEREDKLWDKRLISMVQAYFSDMADILRECGRVVRPNGQAWIVVSTSAYVGIEIPVDLILADIGCRNGWSLRGVNVLRNIRSSSQHWGNLKAGAKSSLRESLIILQRM